VETCNRFLSLTSKLVACNVLRNKGVPKEKSGDCPNERADFYNVFSTLIRMGSSDKQNDKNPRRHVSWNYVLFLGYGWKKRFWLSWGTCLHVCHPASTFEPVTHYYESWNEFYANGRHSSIIHYFSAVRNDGISDAWAIEVGVMPTMCLGHKMMCDNKSWKYVQVLLRQYFCRIWNNSVMSVLKLYLASSFMSVTDESLKFGMWNLVQRLVINISTR